MKKVFVVFAATGEYSDRCEWPIRVVNTEYRAQELIADLDAEAAPLWAQVQDASVADQKHNKKAKDYTEHVYTEYGVRERLFDKEWSKNEPSLREPDYTGFRFHYEPVNQED